jgi:hypothetical protein
MLRTRSLRGVVVAIHLGIQSHTLGLNAKLRPEREYEPVDKQRLACGRKSQANGGVTTEVQPKRRVHNDLCHRLMGWRAAAW